MAAIRLWCFGRSCWWCSRCMNKRSSPAGSGCGRRGPVRKGYKFVALLLKPSLGLFGLVGWRRVLLPHPGTAIGYLIGPGDHHTLQHIQVHFGVDFQADFEDVMWHDVAPTWKKVNTVAGNFVFITLGPFLLFVAIQICIWGVLKIVLLS